MTTEPTDSPANDPAKEPAAAPEKLTLGQLAAREAREWGAALVWFVPIWLIFSTFIYASYHIPSESMQPTLEVGDRVIVSKWPYGFSRHSLPPIVWRALPQSDGRLFGSSPKRGDVIVFRHPRTDVVMIKRVIGIAGDTVEVRDGRLVLNGETMNRANPQRVEFRTRPQYKGIEPPVVSVTRYIETLPGARTHAIYELSDYQFGYDGSAGPPDWFTAETVPVNHVFVMGDNRDNSIDSRFEEGPRMVPVDRIIGRADTVLFTLRNCRKEPGLTCGEPRLWKSMDRKQ